MDKLDAVVHEKYTKMSDISHRRQAVESKIAEKKELRSLINDYRNTRAVVDAGRGLSGKKAEKHRADNESDYILYESALRRLRELVPGSRLPSIQSLNAEIKALTSEKNALYNEYRAAKQEYDTIVNARINASDILRSISHEPKHRHEQTR